MDKRIFISYNWNNEKEVDEIDNFFLSKGIKLIRDKRDTKYKDSFTEFMKSIRKTDYVIMVISDSYLKSRNCMYEVLEFIKDENFKKRILPIILDNAHNVYSVKNSIGYTKFWNNQHAELEEALKGVEPYQNIPVSEEEKVIVNIKNTISEFIKLLRDMKQIPFEDLKKSGFKEILNEMGMVSIDEETNFNYTIVKQEENSHLGAKRYSAKVLVDRGYNKEQLKMIIREITETLKTSQYYRNEKVKERWQGENAHVVWLYLAHDLEDVKLVNWICRTSWIDEKLTKEAKPIKLNGNDKLDDIIIQWNEEYRNQKARFKSCIGTKEEVIKSVEFITKEMTELAERLKGMYLVYQNGDKEIENIYSYVDEKWDKINELYFKGSDLPLAPIECDNYSQTAQEIFATCHNIFLYFSESGRKTWEEKNRKILAKKSMGDLEKLLVKLDIDRERLN